MIREHDRLLDHIRAIHISIRDAIVTACEQTAIEQLAAPVAAEAGDTIFAIDRISETVLLERFSILAETWPCVLIAEGLGSTGQVELPRGLAPEQAELRIIVDPIDGTRGLMYQKRPAWILTGVAPNKGSHTSLADIELAVMTEIPLVKQHLCDTLWAIAGKPAKGERTNRLTGATQPLVLQPSRVPGLIQGYGSIARFYPGARDVLAAIEEELIDRIMGPQPAGLALTFEDQYLCSAGQLYELIMGHDRWIADLRPLVEPILRQRGKPTGLYCHPYDLCTESVARAAGVTVTDENGRPLQAPLDVTTGVAWTGYANEMIAAQIAPVLQALLIEHGLLADEASQPS